MRTFFSYALTLLGIVALYLFASGALNPTQDGRTVAEILRQAARPFQQADATGLIALTIGVACFATGVVLSPRALVLTSSQTPDGTVEERYAQRIQTQRQCERLLEVALTINVLIVASLMILLSYSVTTESPVPTRTLGTIFAIAAIQVLTGLGLVGLLFKMKQTWDRRRRPLFLFSTSLNMIEAVILITIVTVGFF